MAQDLRGRRIEGRGAVLPGRAGDGAGRRAITARGEVPGELEAASGRALSRRIARWGRGEDHAEVAEAAQLVGITRSSRRPRSWVGSRGGRGDRGVGWDHAEVAEIAEWVVSRGGRRDRGVGWD